jgi:hypothetical protein
MLVSAGLASANSEVVDRLQGKGLEMISELRQKVAAL